MYSLTGKRKAAVICYESEGQYSSNVRDTNSMIGTLETLKFEFVNNQSANSPSPNAEDQGNDEPGPPLGYNSLVMRNTKLPHLKVFIEKVISEAQSEDDCVFLYIVAPLDDEKLKTHDGDFLPILDICIEQENAKCPLLFFIQANVSGQVKSTTVLYNTGGTEPSVEILPKSANLLLAHLENHRDAQKSVAEILSEELLKKIDINTCLTQVIARLNQGTAHLNQTLAELDSSSKKLKNSKFSSTLLKQLYLNGQAYDYPRSQQMTRYVVKEGKILVYAFLFTKFPEVPLENLDKWVEQDKEHLKVTFKKPEYEVEFCVREGEMKVEEFRKDLKHIKEEAGKTPCDGIMVIVSSHGEKSDFAFASDGKFSMNEVIEALCSSENLKGKPKILLWDACRGCSEDLHPPPSGENNPEKSKLIPVLERFEMTDTLIATACFKDMLAYAKGKASLFLKSFCHVIREQRGKPETEDILKLLNTTLNEVAANNISRDGYTLKQQPTFTSTLEKLLYLP